jgi:hypothetical protein
LIWQAPVSVFYNCFKRFQILSKNNLPTISKQFYISSGKITTKVRIVRTENSKAKEGKAIASEYELRDHILSMLQQNTRFSNAMKEAILLRKRDQLTMLVQEATTNIGANNLHTQTIRSVVDWLIELLG